LPLSQATLVRGASVRVTLVRPAYGWIPASLLPDEPVVELDQAEKSHEGRRSQLPRWLKPVLFSKPIAALEALRHPKALYPDCRFDET